MTLTFALAGAALLVAILAGHRSLARAIVRPPAPPPVRAQYPSLTVVRPIKGLDVGARENLEALFAADYPGWLQFLLVLDDEDDPACEVTRAVAREQQARGVDVEVLFSGAPPRHRTGKLNAMIAALEHGTGELVAFNDSDTRPPPELTRVLVDALLSTPRAGASFAPVAAVFEGTPTAGDVGYALLLNAWYGPSAALAAGSTSELPFIMGQYMVFTREALEAIGGLSCADGQFVDDMWIGRRVVAAGMRNVQIRQVLPIVTGGSSFTTFLQTFRRWLTFGRGGLPWSFLRPHVVRGALYAGACILAVWALRRGDVPGALMPTLAAATFVWSGLDLARRCGGPPIPPRHLWMAVALPFIGALVMLSSFVWRRVDWRGRSYALDGAARLADGPGLAEAEPRRA